MHPSEFFKCEYHGKQFLLRCCIIHLDFVEGLTCVVYGMHFSFLPLSKHGAYGVVTCITHDLEGKVPVRRLHNGHTYEGLLECSKSMQANTIEDEFCVF